MGNLFSKLEKPDALQLLDDDCWRLVLRKLNAEDLLSCRQVCKPFQKLLDEEEFQKRWKFHLALPLLFEYLKTGENQGGHFYHSTTWKTLHSLRSTCQSWQQSVDNYATEYKPTVFPDLMSDFPLATCLYSSKLIDDFRKKFGSETNPFPSRTVFISNSLPGQIRNRAEHRRFMEIQMAYVVKVGDFLEQFGKHIVNLQVAFQLPDAADHLSLYKFIKRITSHLPNMKTFNIRNLLNRQEVNEHQLAAFIRENPLGEMPKLKALQISGLNTMLEDHLLDKYASQLSHFDRINPRGPFKEVYARQFGNLRELSYDLLSSSDTLQVLRFLKSPLKILKVDMDASTGCGHLYWYVDKVFDNIKHLPIETFEAKLGAINVPRGVTVVEKPTGLQPNEYINKNIQTVRIEFVMTNGYLPSCTRGEISFNFLQALPKLEKLKLAFSPPGRVIPTFHPEYFVDVPEVVRLNEYLMDQGRTGTPYQSNLWEKVPSLKILTVKRTRDLGAGDGLEKLEYSREKYEELNENVEK